MLTYALDRLERKLERPTLGGQKGLTKYWEVLEGVEMVQRGRGKDVAARAKGKADRMHTDGGGRGAASEVPGRCSVVRFAAVIC